MFLQRHAFVRAIQRWLSVSGSAGICVRCIQLYVPCSYCGPLLVRPFSFATVILWMCTLVYWQLTPLQPQINLSLPIPAHFLGFKMVFYRVPTWNIFVQILPLFATILSYGPFLSLLYANTMGLQCLGVENVRFTYIRLVRVHNNKTGRENSRVPTVAVVKYFWGFKTFMF